MKYYIPTILIALTITMLPSCNNSRQDTHPVGEIIELDLDKGLKNKKTYPLSHFADQAEIIEIEASLESYIQDPVLWHIGERHILVLDKRELQLFLFDRDGQFIRRIGQKGKGPGEYSTLVEGTMNPDETKILVFSPYTAEAMVFDTNGQLIAQAHLGPLLPTNMIMGMVWKSPDCIDLLTHRPAQAEAVFPRVVQVTGELEFIREVAVTKMAKQMGQWDMLSHHIFSHENETYFWISDNDTIFHYDQEGNTRPAYVLDQSHITNAVKKNKTLQPGDQTNGTVYIYSVNFLPDHLLIMMGTPNGFVPVFYNLKKDEIFSIQEEAQCLTFGPGFKAKSIRNDLCGFEEVSLRHFYSSVELCALTIPLDLPFFETAAPCFKTLDVAQPAVRDQLCAYFINPPRNLGVVILVYQMK